ncbi:DUF2752 domain-containing protein [Parablautia muri]|uniref:DUF2752 domain-containing protein n=1 Tax=Parablautia muri TaxID=2320879 RepID=A0A9X5GTB4_9FIRM|nr:DUF2752 domain-containing protein [Parablautia muri]NBJ93625.1 DUF2752 domain-containing protein [Parablautia muri]
MKSKRRKELLNILPAVAAVIIVYALFTVLGIGCPVKFVTGISCMGCGMTRAWLAVLRLDFKSAFYYHPAFWLPPFVIIFLFLKNKINIKNYKIFMFTAAAIFVIIYFVRLIYSNGDIVVFQPENNILSKIVQKFIP